MGGQNQNIYMVRFALCEIHQAGMFHRTEFVFLVSGHSYLPCNKSFGHIEKMLSKESFLFDIDMYIALIESSVKKKFEVTHMKKENFFNLRVLESFIKKPQTEGRFSKTSQFIITHQFPDGFLLNP